MRKMSPIFALVMISLLMLSACSAFAPPGQTQPVPTTVEGGLRRRPCGK